MLRSSLIAAGVGLLCSSALAQNVRTAVPINVPIKDGGTLDWATGTWHHNSGSFANAPGANVIFENTCNFSGGAFYSPNANCWDQYDEGRLPTGDAADPFNSTVGLDAGQLCSVYALCGFQYGYCTDEITPAQGGVGNVQHQIAFIEGFATSGVGGICMDAGGALGSPIPPSGAPSGNAKPDPSVPQAPFAGPNDLYIDLQGLPGAAANGNTNCWLITLDLSNTPNGGFAFAGDGGDGFQGTADGADSFNILYGLRGNTETGATATGFFLAGDFAVAGGTGAFGVPQGLDPLDGVTPCGTGLDIADASWINEDGSIVGSTAVTNCVSIAGNLPSNCYFFGGWPAAPVSDAYMIMWANTTCIQGTGGSSITPYCTAKASSSGCLASMGGSTTGPVVSGANDWSVQCTGMQANRPGIFFGSNIAQAAINFQGGTLCVQPPTKRSPILFTAGTNNTCTGTFTLLINNGAFFPPPNAGSGFDGGPGGTSFMQAWYRDPALMDGFDTALSNGLQIDWM